MQRWRDRLQGGHHVLRSPRSRDGMPRRGRDGGTARVRHWRCQCTTRAMRMRARYDLTPRRAAGLWPAHERREGLAQHAPPVGGNLRVVARVKATDTYDALQAPWRRGCQRSRQRTTRRSPPCWRGRAQQHAHGPSRRSRYLEVAPDVSVQRLAHGPLRCFGRCHAHGRGN